MYLRPNFIKKNYGMKIKRFEACKNSSENV